MERIAAQSSRLIECRPRIEPAISAAEIGKLQSGRAEDQAALEQLARDHYSERVVSKAEFLAARMPLQERIAAAERLIDQATMSRHEVCSDDAPASQDDMEVGIEERRRLITAWLEKVLIRPAPRPGTRRYDPTRISVVSRAGEVLAVVQTATTEIELRDGDGEVRLAL